MPDLRQTKQLEMIEQKCGEGNPSSEITIKYKISGIESKPVVPEKPIEEVTKTPDEIPKTSTDYSIENPAPEESIVEDLPPPQEKSNPDQEQYRTELSRTWISVSTWAILQVQADPWSRIMVPMG